MNRSIYIIGGAVLLILVLWLAAPKERTVQTVETPVPEQTQTSESVNKIYQRAQALEKDQDFVKAKEAYETILTEYTDFENIEEIQGRLEQLNLNIIFSNVPTKDTVVHEVVSGNTLGELAKKYGTTVELIKKRNHLKSDVIRIGQKLSIWTGGFNIFVDKSQNILMLKQGDEILKVYNVSTGKGSSTPVGNFTITTKLVDPVWFNRGVVVPPESPQNVLGSRWLGFDTPGYGIHGTIEPETIGQQVTAGCVRMRNKDVEQLYSIIPMGTKVVVVN